VENQQIGGIEYDFFQAPRYPYSSLSELFNPFNCIISFFKDNVDSDDNINNVKDHKAINQFILFSNMDINNKSFNEKTRTYITEVGAFKTKDILERHKNEVYSPFYGTDIIDINTLASKIICAGAIDKKNVKLIGLFLDGEYKLKTYSLKVKEKEELLTSFCELEKYFSEKKEILIGIINYDFKDVKNDVRSNTPMPRRKIKEILINPDQKEYMSLGNGDRVITIS
jgi:Asp-tRNA(Asn)/Glu-tRNA(Gln) amidotransferase C subunit